MNTLRWTAVMPFTIVIAERLARHKSPVRNALCVAALVAVLSSLAPLLSSEMTLSDWLHDRITHGVTPSVVLASVAVMFGYILAGREEAAALRRRSHELEALRTRTRHDLFRARIAPRFLFSALDDIAQAVPSEPARAEQAVLDFADLLRNLMDINREEAITFERELDVIDRFVAITLRTPVVATADDESLQSFIEPLTLFRVVASLATLHPRSIALDAREEHAIAVSLTITLPHLLLPPEEGGIGPNTLREFIRTGASRLSHEVEVSGSTAVVRLSLPVRPGAEPAPHESQSRDR